MRIVIIAGIAMWIFHKHHTRNSESKKGDRVVDTNRVKTLSTEWEGVSNELSVIQHIFEAEQIAYNQAVQNLAAQRFALSSAREDLNELKMELSHYLKSNKIHVEQFKHLSEDCITSYLTYESEEQKMSDMDHEFKNAYADWDTRCDERLSKINSMRDKIKSIENEIKKTCSDV